VLVAQSPRDSIPLPEHPRPDFERAEWVNLNGRWRFAFDAKNPSVKGIDYTKPIAKVALILKDTMNNKPQGDPKYVPTDLHIEVTWLSQGATYAAPLRPPPPPWTDAGVSDASAHDASVDAATHDAGDPIWDDTPMPPLTLDAGTPSNAHADSATSVRDASASADASDNEPSDGEKHDDGCSVAHSGRAGMSGYALVAASLLLARRRRRR